MLEQLRWKKYNVLNDGFICLVDVMGDDPAIVQAARVSYGKDLVKAPTTHLEAQALIKQQTADRGLIRRLMMDSHTSPFEMVSFKFKVRVPMDCWRQWVRHRTAKINEFSTRYSEAIDSQQTTSPQEWRLQATNNKQGSSGFLDEDKNIADFLTEQEGLDLILNMDEYWVKGKSTTAALLLTNEESLFHKMGRKLYELRLKLGIAREQARKDLPLSTYTEAYWKCDLHNIFNFLRLRLDTHAQLEIRLYAQAMYEIVKQICPIACEAFEDYVLHAKRFSRMEMELINRIISDHNDTFGGTERDLATWTKSSNMTDNEWTQFKKKINLV